MSHSFPSRRSSALLAVVRLLAHVGGAHLADHRALAQQIVEPLALDHREPAVVARFLKRLDEDRGRALRHRARQRLNAFGRSEEHTSELQSLMRISYAVFCLKNKTQNTKHLHSIHSSHQPQA